MIAALSFVKGHGTENDFVLIPDPDGSVDLSAGQIRALCDRRAGLGADGVIRVTPDERGGFFMDYHNADASAAEMCGNGARVFVRFLIEAGWQAAGSFDFSTRGGPRSAHAGPSGDVSISMGPVELGGPSTAITAEQRWPGLAADVGNPHLVCRVDQNLTDLDLSTAPEIDRAMFPAGVNVEFVDLRAAGAVTMRVFERGSGETRSCGTGTVAAAAVHLAGSGGQQGDIDVRIPGGRVRVGLTGGQRDASGRIVHYRAATLTGPAVLVARGEIDAEFLAAHR